MLKIFKYLKSSFISVLVIIALLVVQAVLDLTLPDYTSKIVNVGVQQGGIENAAITQIGDESLNKLVLLLDDKDKNYILDNYEKDKKYKKETIYKLNKDADKEKVSNFIKNAKEFDLSSLEEKKDNSLKAIKKKIVLDKMKYIESAKTKEDKEDIKYDFFTRSEALTLLEQLRGKDEYIDSSEDELDVTDFWEAEYNDGIDGFEHTYQTVHYHKIRIGDKLISFDDRDGVNTIIDKSIN